MEARKTQLLLVSLVALFVLQTVTPNVTAEPAEPQVEPQLGGKHIVLVHGAGLGAWSWFKLIPLLRFYGYNVTAFDLAASGVDPRQVTDIPSMADYFQPLRDFMASLPPREKVMLVGHSLGGLAICQSMELFPEKISVAVFLTALMPGPTYNISTLNSDQAPTQNLGALDNMLTYGNGTSNPPTALLFGPKYLRTMLFQLSPVQDWVLATLLVRTVNLYSDENMSKVLRLTTVRYGSVKRVFIISGLDKVIVPSFQRLMIEKNPPTEVQEIATSDHMVMMSRTSELSIRLSGIAQSYN